MFKRQKGFTLIELIVVIAVLGILAAIVIPNISGFQRQAREVALTADLRNIQTALDMHRALSPSGVEEPVYPATGTPVTFNAGGTDLFHLLRLEGTGGLVPTSLRSVPDYVQNATAAAAPILQTYIDALDFTRGEVVAGIRLNAGASTSIVNFVTGTNFAAGGAASRVVR